MYSNVPSRLGYRREIKPDGWGGRWESNPQRPEPQSGALPVELLPPHFLDYTENQSSNCGLRTSDY